MKYFFTHFSLIGLVMLSSACAPINTKFSCNSTADDKCLSIEEVNAMTETAQEKQTVVHEKLYQNYTHHTAQTIWMIDEKGGHYVD